MPGTVITVTSGKGGVGKTTTATNVAVALALQGKRVITVDADIGLRNLDLVMGLENRILHDLVDVVEGRCQLQQALVRDTRVDSLYLLAAAQTRDKADVGIQQMVAVCKSLSHMADYVIIDSPAGIERGFRNAVAPADKVLVVTNPEVSAVRDADRIIGLIEAEEKGPGQLILNRVKPAMVGRGDMLSVDDVLDILAVELLGVIPEDERILVASNQGLPLVMHGVNGASAGEAFRNVARRLEGEDVPFVELVQKQTFMSRLRALMNGQ